MFRKYLIQALQKPLAHKQLRFFSGASLSIFDKTISPKLRPNDYLINRHIGPSEKELQEMLKTVGVSSVNELILQTIPKHILDENACEGVGDPIPEQQMLAKMRRLSEKNKLYKTYIGCGFYDNYMPPVIQRNLFENPGWYTAYTPYQAEISQGRLESLLNY